MNEGKLPITDDHLHLNPRRGRGIEAIKELKKQNEQLTKRLEMIERGNKWTVADLQLFNTGNAQLWATGSRYW